MPEIPADNASNTWGVPIYSIFKNKDGEAVFLGHMRVVDSSAHVFGVRLGSERPYFGSWHLDSADGYHWNFSIDDFGWDNSEMVGSDPQRFMRAFSDDEVGKIRGLISGLCLEGATYDFYPLKRVKDYFLGKVKFKEEWIRRKPRSLWRPVSNLKAFASKLL
jgi:hypothetical protein